MYKSQGKQLWFSELYKIFVQVVPVYVAHLSKQSFASLEYGVPGYKAGFLTSYIKEKIPLQIDVGAGSATTAGAVNTNFK